MTNGNPATTPTSSDRIGDRWEDLKNRILDVLNHHAGDTAASSARPLIDSLRSALAAYERDLVAPTDQQLWAMAYVAFHGYNRDQAARDVSTARRLFGAETVDGQIAKMRAAVTAANLSSSAGYAQGVADAGYQVEKLREAMRMASPYTADDADLADCISEIRALVDRTTSEVPAPTDDDYQDWLQETGRDDSFVGSSDLGVNGTFEDFLEEWKARYQDKPSPPTP